MDDLPELPFEKVLSYLSLEDRIKSRAVSRRWYYTINSFKVKSLCYSKHPAGFIRENNRWARGSFAENFISCSRFASFFNAFRESILSNLKHLRLCDLILGEEDRAAFAPTVQSFGQLEELDIIRFDYPRGSNPKMNFKLNLPMLRSIQLENVRGIQKLTLDAPKLKNVKISTCALKADFVHIELFERLVIDRLHHIPVKSLKNLLYLYIRDSESIDSTLLSSLEKLKEIHFNYLSQRGLPEFFELKERIGRAELKVYLLGLLLSGPDDPAIRSLQISYNGFDKRALHCLAENPSRLADEIPFENRLCCSSIERVASDSESNVLKRLTDLSEIYLESSVQNIELFLDNLKNFDNISDVGVSSVQPQDLFDRLPEHCAVQRLYLYPIVTDLRFLFRLKNLIILHLRCSIEAETIRRLFEELTFLSEFTFKCKDKAFEIETGHSKPFEILVTGKKTVVADLNAAIQFIIENAPRKRKAKVLSE